MRRATASRGRSLRNQEGPSTSPRGKAKAKAGMEERAKAKEKAKAKAKAKVKAKALRVRRAPREVAPVKDGLTTWSRTRPKEKTPGLRDAFREAGWTVVTRKSRNRQQCSRRRGCFDKRGTILGSLCDVDNDLILEHRTKKEW